MTPSESYYHDKNFERPFKIELKIKLNPEEKNALNNFFIASCLNREYSGTTDQRLRKGKIMDHVMKKFGNKLFEEFYDEITIVLTTSRVNYPPDILFKLHKNDKILNFYHNDASKTKPNKSGGYSSIGLSELILRFANTIHPKLEKFIEEGRGNIPKFTKFDISLFDETYQNTNEKTMVHFGGFQFNEYESRYENTHHFFEFANL